MKKLVFSICFLVLFPFVNILNVNAREYVDFNYTSTQISDTYDYVVSTFSSSSHIDNVSDYIFDYMETNFPSVDTSYYAFFFSTYNFGDNSIGIYAMFSDTDNLYLMPGQSIAISNASNIDRGDWYLFKYQPLDNTTSFVVYSDYNYIPLSDASISPYSDIFAIFNTNFTYFTTLSSSFANEWDFTINSENSMTILTTPGLNYPIAILVPNGITFGYVDPYADYNKFEFTANIDSIVFYLKDLQGLPLNSSIQKQFFFNGTFTRFDFALNDFKDIYLTNEDYLINDYLTSILYPNNTISNRDMSVWGISNFDDEPVSKLLGIAFDNSTAPYFKKVILTGEDDRTIPMSSLYYIYYADNLGFITFDKYGAIVSTDSGNTTITIIDDEGTPIDYDLSLFNSISSITLPPKFGMLSAIITLPLQYIGELTNGTCSALSVPLPNNLGFLTLPCGSDIYSNFEDIFTLYQTITTGIIAYFVAIKSFTLFKEFRDPDSDTLEVVDL